MLPSYWVKLIKGEKGCWWYYTFWAGSTSLTAAKRLATKNKTPDTSIAQIFVTDAHILNSRPDFNGQPIAYRCYDKKPDGWVDCRKRSKR